MRVDSFLRRQLQSIGEGLVPILDEHLKFLSHGKCPALFRPPIPQKGSQPIFEIIVAVVPATCGIMLMLLAAPGMLRAPRGSSIPKSRNPAFNLGSNLASWNPTPGGVVLQKEKAGTLVPASCSSRSLVLEKTYRFFFFAAFFFFLAAFFGFDFFAFFFGTALFFAAFLAGFFAAFLAGFFAAGLGAVFGAGASSSGSSPTITSSSSSVSTISSVSPANSSSSSSRDSSLSSSKLSFSKSMPSSPRGISGPRLQRGSTGRCSGRSYLKFHPVLEPLLPYSPGVVKHSAVFLRRDCRDGGEWGANKPQWKTLRDPCSPVIHSCKTT